MAEIDVGFRGRLAYLRWLDSRGHISPPSDREFSASLGLGESWVRKWKNREDAPERRTEQAAFERRFGAEATRWLYDGVGKAPEPAQWTAWRAQWKPPLTVPVMQNVPADRSGRGHGKKRGSG